MGSIDYPFRGSGVCRWRGCAIRRRLPSCLGRGAQAEASGRDAHLVAEISSHLVERRDFPGVVERFLSTGTEPWKNDVDQSLADELQIWRELHEQFNGSQRELTLRAYLDFFALASKTPSCGPNAIRCSTIHQAKGLQFEHVYLVGLTQDILPSYYAIRPAKGVQRMEEERRACFVAITRARKSLTLTGARRHNHFPKSESQFLREMRIRLGGHSG